VGQIATIERDENYDATIDKIYPQVVNGQFELDLGFTQCHPSEIHRGQSLHAKLLPGDTFDVLRVPNGSFYADTGGDWMFVIDESQNAAIRRTVKPGRRNSRFIEVLDGLEDTEQVVISSYSTFANQLKLGL
jgi:HlyD family secretion protein